MFTIKVAGTIFVALALLAVAFYYGGAFTKQTGESTGLQFLKDAGQGGMNLGITIVVILIIIAVVIVYYLYNQQGGTA